MVRELKSDVHCISGSLAGSMSHRRQSRAQPSEWAMRIPARTRSGRRVYNLVTNESLLAEEKRLNAACLLSAKSRKSANEHTIFKSRKRKTQAEEGLSVHMLRLQRSRARLRGKLYQARINPPAAKKRSEPRKLQLQY